MSAIWKHCFDEGVVDNLLDVTSTWVYILVRRALIHNSQSRTLTPFLLIA
jgi:hypothetical protein